MDKTPIEEQFKALRGSLQGDALEAARSVEGALDRSRALGEVASRTYPLEAALPLWNEAADAARQIENPAVRTGRLSSLIGGLERSVH